MRDRLIELLIEGHKQYLFYDQIADYLLANGVIAPPCKVGDTVYCLDDIVWDVIQEDIPNLKNFLEDL